MYLGTDIGSLKSPRSGDQVWPGPMVLPCVIENRRTRGHDRREETELNTHYSQHIQCTELHPRDSVFSHWAMVQCCFHETTPQHKLWWETTRFLQSSTLRKQPSVLNDSRRGWNDVIWPWFKRYTSGHICEGVSQEVKWRGKLVLWAGALEGEKRERRGNGAIILSLGFLTVDALWASAPHSCYRSGSCPHCHAYSTLTKYTLKLWLKLGDSFKCFSWSLGYNREKCNSHNFREILTGKESLISENAQNLLTVFFF